METSPTGRAVENRSIGGITCWASRRPDFAGSLLAAGPPVVRTGGLHAARVFMNSANQGRKTASETQPSAREIARRLISSGRLGRDDGESTARATAAACDNLYRALSRWVGPDGCHALFARALADTRIEYPALTQVQLRARSEPYIDSVAETIIAHGDAATAEALESLLVRLVELLGRLIGDDMAMKLIERSLVASETGRPSGGKREEA
jgi:hypothetical protein